MRKLSSRILTGPGSRCGICDGSFCRLIEERRIGKNFGIAASLFKSLSSTADAFDPLSAIGRGVTTVISG